MKIDRLVSILMILINRDKVTAKELAERFEVSVRTIQRDMDNLNMAGIPIYADVGKNGGYQIMDEYKLHKNFLNADEAKVFVSFINSLQNTVPQADVSSFCDKFRTLLPEESNEQKLVIKLNPQLNQKRLKEYLDQLTKARDDEKMVTIQYVDAKLEPSKRIINPYTLVMMGTIWYVYGYCHMREDFRLFKVNRIVECETLEESFNKQPLPEDMPWENFFHTERPCVPMVLEVDKALQGNITEYFDIKDCEIQEDKIVARVNYPIDEWVYSFLAGMIPHVKVIEPTFVREEFIRRIKKTLEIHQL